MPKAKVDSSHIPPELMAAAQWVCWKYVMKTAGKTKIPYTPGGSAAAKTNDPKTWRDFDKAAASLRRYDGIGFVVTSDDPWCGVDIDHCIDKETGAIHPVASEIVEQLNSYTEITPSGEGLRVWVRAKIPAAGRRKRWRGVEVEMYDSGRYFTMTGRLMSDVLPTIEDRQGQITDLHSTIWRSRETQSSQPSQPPLVLSDSEIIQRALNASNGHRFGKLWRGDTSDYDNDPSRADQALCFHLAFWTGGSADVIDKLFRQSGLYRPKWDERRGDTTYGADTIAKAARMVSVHYNPQRSSQTSDVPDQQYMRTDLGNAERLANRFGNDLRWWDDRQNYFVWDGRRWLEDRTLQVYRWARDTVRGMYRDAEALEDDKRRDLIKWAVSSESAGKLTAMVQLCRMVDGIPIKAGAMDGEDNEMMFNTLSGTIDLRTGALRPHRREDLISKLSAVAYDENATAPLWQVFLKRVTGGDQELIDYLARVVGYCMTGCITDKALFIAWGTNDTGKSTFLETIRCLLGDYSGNLRPESIMVRRNETVPHDIAKLEGCRFVTVGETEQGQRLASALVKRFSGGDIISARLNYDKREHEFSPTWKLIIGTNHKPVIHDDTAWNRIRLIPFAISIPKAEQDKELRQKLRKELPGILNWAISGCLDWQKRGDLSEPTAVLSASADYKSEMDPLGAFFEDVCVLNLAAWTPTASLREAYEAWCQAEGVHPVHSNILGERLRNMGCTPEHKKVQGKKVRIWRGIELQSQNERGTAGTAGYTDSYNFFNSFAHVEFMENDVPRRTPYPSDSDSWEVID